MERLFNRILITELWDNYDLFNIYGFNKIINSRFLSNKIAYTQIAFFVW